MPHWVEFNQIRSGKELEIFDEFSSFKKMKDYGNKKKRRLSSATLQDETNKDDEDVIKNYNFV